MRSLISPIIDIINILRDELAYRKHMRNLVVLKRVPIPPDRVREFLLIYDRIANDDLVYTPKYSRTARYDMHVLLSEIDPDYDPSYFAVVPDFIDRGDVEAVLYK